MRTKIVITDLHITAPKDSDILYRNAVINNAYQPGIILSIVDEDDHLYVGVYEKRPRIYGNNIIIKTTCGESITYKNNRFTGTMSIQAMMNYLKRYVPRFEFIDNDVIGKINKITAIKIIKGKITNTNDIWRDLAKQAGFLSWKAYKKIKCAGISPLQVKAVCDDYLAINDIDDIDLTDLMALIRYAIITNQRVKLSWSRSRMNDEISKMNAIIKLEQIKQKSTKPIWGTNLPDINIPDVGRFKILNTEREIFETAERFHNCVYSSFYRSQLNQDYMVLANDSICIGISFPQCNIDQIKGLHNALIDSKQELIIRKYAPDIVWHMKYRGFFDVTPPEKTTKEDLKTLADLPDIF